MDQRTSGIVESERLQEVEAQGWGVTLEAARDDCLRAALHEVVGPQVMSWDELRNDSIIHSVVTSYCDGVVESAREIGAPQQRHGLWFVRCRYLVRPRALQEAISRAQKGGSSRDIDMTQVVTEWDWKERQEREAVKMVTHLFQDYPENILQVDIPPRNPTSRESSQARSVFEVSVRVSVDPVRWSEWTHRVARLLSRLAESKGEERWSLRQPGAIQLVADAAEPVDADSGWFTDGARAIEFRRIQPLREVLPEHERAGALLYIRESPGKYRDRALVNPACLSKPRVLAIFDPDEASVRWWQLPPAAWDQVRRVLQRDPAVEVRLTDDEGRPLGEPVRDWWRDSIGPYVEQRIGWPELRARLGSDRSPKFRVAWSLSPNAGGVGFSHLVIPYATLELSCSKGTGFAYAPVTVFPYRFQIYHAQLKKLKGQPQVEWNWTRH